ncbi:MAG: DUF4437 domain-containing protein, partial [Gammaproteobacteria bacterium]|nr:DUF4437 domain-containing protein [Gammaproteobacteria bacterium]
SNVVWLPLMQQPGQPGGAEISYLWGTFGDHDWNGSFVKLPSGFEGVLKSQGGTFHSVVIRGGVNYWLDGARNNLTPGSYISAQGQTEHRISSDAEDESIIYIRTNGPYQLRQSN